MGPDENREGLSERASDEMARLDERGLTELGAGFQEGTQRAMGERSFHGGAETAEAHPVRLDKNQIVWLRPLGAVIDDQGYKRIEVSDKPPRSDAAIIAALTALTAVSVDPPEKVRGILPLIERLEGKEPRPEESLGERLGDHGEDLLDATLLEPMFRAFVETRLGLAPGMRRHLNYVEDLLRYYRPGFDELSREERASLMEHTCRHMNGFLDALRKLIGFVEHGTVRGTLSPAVKDASRDVAVAELHDVSGKSYVEIAKIMGEPPPEKHTAKNDHPTVRKMGDRGRRILETAFGKEGWEERIAATKEEAARWSSLSVGEGWVETVSMLIARTEFVGMPLEEARAYVSRVLDRKATAQGVTREEAARRWAERYVPTASADDPSD